MATTTIELRSRLLEYIEQADDSRPLSLELKYKSIRTYQLKQFPYRIHFIYEEGRIMVMGVFHEKSSPKSWEDRLVA